MICDFRLSSSATSAFSRFSSRLTCANSVFAFRSLRWSSPLVVLDQGFDLAAEKAQERIPVDRPFAELQPAGPDCVDDIILRQPELLPCRLVAERRSFPLPLGCELVHRFVLLSGRSAA